jgi:multidrug efflux pump subunit AcrA (membrane-fusion protein)
MVHVVAEVKDPYGRATRKPSTPLAVGMFVRAEIHGRQLENVFVLPRSALRGQDRVLVVDRDDRLHYRKVQVARSDREQVLVSGGLATGDRVCVSPLDVAVDGMKVRTAPNARTTS